MKTKIQLSVLLLIVILTTGNALAQPPGLPATPSQAPIDGGLSLLAAAGGLYAWKKLRESPRA